MDNSFILKLQKDDIKPRTDKKLARVASAFIKLFNSHNRFFKIKFKNDKWNRFFGIAHSEKYDSAENTLKDNMLCMEQAINIYHLLSQTLAAGVPGDVVELGCFKGTTSLLIQMTLDQNKSEKRLHVYDSFEGLPELSEKDISVQTGKGSMKTTEDSLVENFATYNVRLPEIHAGWFKDTLPSGLPQQISFAHLDGDLYSSIMESLMNVYPKLSKGAVVVIDDYCDPYVYEMNHLYPGVKKACDEFFADKPEKVNVLIAGCKTHGYFRKE